MCNNYVFKPPSENIADLFRGGLIYPEGKPNLPDTMEVRIGDRAPVLLNTPEGAALVMRPWAWKSPQGRPVFNFRSEGRSFEGSRRCLIPAAGFYEFTAPPAGEKRKTKWLFSMNGEETFWIAGLVRDESFTMLTTSPGPDVAPYHDRQIVVLPTAQGPDWLYLSRPQAELLRPLPAGSLSVAQAWP